MDIARETIELRDRDRAAQRSRLGECRGQLRSAIERVASLAGLDLDELRREVEARLAGEPGQRVGAALRCRDWSGFAAFVLTFDRICPLGFQAA